MISDVRVAKTNVQTKTVVTVDAVSKNVWRYVQWQPWHPEKCSILQWLFVARVCFPRCVNEEDKTVGEKYRSCKCCCICPEICKINYHRRIHPRILPNLLQHTKCSPADRRQSGIFQMFQCVSWGKSDSWSVLALNFEFGVISAAPLQISLDINRETLVSLSPSLFVMNAGSLET